MAAKYNCLLFDIDGTLLDIVGAEREAIGVTLREFDLPDTDAAAAMFRAINANLWVALERGEIKKEKLVVKRFTQLLEQLGAKGDPIRMNNAYLTHLSCAAVIFPGADETLAELAEFATLAAVANGTYKQLCQRLEKCGLLPYFDEIFVSEKLGVTKPSPKFYDMALKKLGVTERSKVLVIGDGLTADIKGGIAARLDTCWCNFAGVENNTQFRPTYTAQSFAQLKLLAVGEEALKLAETREKRHTV